MLLLMFSNTPPTPSQEGKRNILQIKTPWNSVYSVVKKHNAARSVPTPILHHPASTINYQLSTIN